MSLEDGFNIVDCALDLALIDLEKRGMPRDEAYIALFIRLNRVIPEDVLEVARLLAEDEEINSAINSSKLEDSIAENAVRLRVNSLYMRS